MFDQVSTLLGPYTLWLAIPSLGLPLAWWYFLPRPLPGIPYDVKSARYPWGDIPKLMKAAKSHKDVIKVFTDLSTDLNSPVVEFLGNPFGKTHTVLITDFRETEDILTRRTKEFDRIDASQETTSPILRESTVNMVSNDRFKAQRKLWAGVMTPEFVNKIASSHIYDSCERLVSLWKRKAELAAEQPFFAGDDLRFEGFDAIWGFTFGTDLGSTQAQLKHQLEINENSLQRSKNKKQLIELPKGDPPSFYQTIMAIITPFVDIGFSLFAELRIWLLVKSPSYRRALADKDAKTAELVASSRAAFNDKTVADEELATSAMDQVLRRLHNSKIESLTSSAKDPDQHLKDELFLFLVAGYETTSTALSWGVKFLAAYQEVQRRLREELRAAFPDTSSPSAHDIIHANLPYLEAFIAEVLRCSMIAGGVARKAKTDTSILGFPIPKDTILLLFHVGQTYFGDKPLEIPEEKRSVSSRQYNSARGQHYSWPEEGREEFRPERWLRKEMVTHEDGTTTTKDVYDEHAGPSMPFGLGPRGCFGKRLALAKLRINFARYVSAFDFLEVKGKGKAKNGKEFDLASWEGVEKITRMPTHTYIRLRTLEN